MAELNQTPGANRLHIALLGKRNAGKSSLINALAGQEVSLVSSVAGTTTDPVSRAIEISPLGACALVDTAGFDDTGELGAMRVEKTRAVLDKADIAVIVCRDGAGSVEKDWADTLRGKNIPFVAAVSQSDRQANAEALAEQVRESLKCEVVITSAKENTGIDELKGALVRLVPEDFGASSIVGHLVEDGDTVLLIMPQDIQAPKGRLILPQVQTIRDLLDNKCVVISATLDKMDAALAALASPPKLIITDSQVFPAVYAKKPEGSLLTSFSVLFARHKGDIHAFAEGAAAIDALREGDRVLIAEACAHDPKDGDIGREKIPALLRKKAGSGLIIDVVSGAGFNRDLSGYSLIIHCGACMFNRKLVLSRIEKAKGAGVPITNYGIAIAKLTGILDKIEL